jgi:hypothetical protein
MREHKKKSSDSRNNKLYDEAIQLNLKVSNCNVFLIAENECTFLLS